MTARLIDGKAIAQQYRAEFAIRVERLKDRGILPGLAVVIVGDDPASQIYVRNKALASGTIGMHSEVHALSADTTEAQLIAFVKALNANDAIHGIASDASGNICFAAAPSFRMECDLPGFSPHPP